MTDEEQFKGGRGRLGLQFSENVVLRGEEGTPARSGGSAGCVVSISVISLQKM